jgi:hypothetical protein
MTRLLDNAGRNYRGGRINPVLIDFKTVNLNIREMIAITISDIIAIIAI